MYVCVRVAVLRIQYVYILCVYIYKKKRDRSCVSQHFSATLPAVRRWPNVMKNGESSAALSPPSSSILAATDTLDCHYLFCTLAFVRRPSARFLFFFYLGRGHAVLPVSTLFAPFVAHGGRSLLRIFEPLRAAHTFFPLLSSRPDPFVARIVSICFSAENFSGPSPRNG